MLIGYHPQFFADDLAAACAGLDGVTFQRVATPEELVPLAASADALVLSAGHYTPALADAARAPGARLRWLQFTTAGTDPAARLGVPAGVTVTNASAAWAPGVAEHAVALLLASLRQLPALLQAQREGRWAHAEVVPALDYLDGARIGILGFGAIGQGIAARLKPFGAAIVALVRSERTAAADETRLVAGARLDDLDAVVSSLPLTPDTAGLVDAAFLARLRDGAIFVNVGRGQTVDEPALLAALATFRLRAALDVFDTEPLPPGHPAWAAGNLIVSPHLAALGGRAGPARLLSICRDNIARFRDGAALRHVVTLA